MKLLLDANLSPQVRDGLCEQGHDTVHVTDVGLLHADDEAILAFAANDGYVLVTADHDFGAMVALARATQPSVLHLRGIGDLRPGDHLDLLVENLTQVTDDLEAGAIVSLSPTRLAVRRLPIVEAIRAQSRQAPDTQGVRLQTEKRGRAIPGPSIEDLARRRLLQDSQPKPPQELSR